MPETPDDLIPAKEDVPLADALRSLEPASTAISRDRLLFEAGWAAARPAWAWIWPTGTFLLAGVSMVLAGLLMFPEDRAPTIVERERIVIVKVPVSVEPQPLPNSPSPRVNEIANVDSNLSTEAARMFQVRRDVMLWGPEMLPVSKPTANLSSPSETARDLDRWLDVPPGTFAAPYQKSPRLFPNFFGVN